MNYFKTPILLIVFNRPETTEKVFASLREVRPEVLFIAADGPRKDRVGEKQMCERVRKVTERIDWKCEVKRLYRKENLGCKVGVSTAISWFFGNVDRGIILEDDCSPSMSFFRFAAELLKKYENNEKIMQICGTNTVGEWKRNGKSYFFSNYGSVWGWATWRRAWKKFDVDMRPWKYASSKEKVEKILGSKLQFFFRSRVFDRSYKGKIDAWSYAWSFARLINDGVSIVPSVNLVKNIGFGEDAAHTKSTVNSFSNLVAGKMDFPLRHPKKIVVDRDFDKEYFLNMSIYTYIRSLLHFPEMLIKRFF